MTFAIQLSAPALAQAARGIKPKPYDANRRASRLLRLIDSKQLDFPQPISKTLAGTKSDREVKIWPWEHRVLHRAIAQQLSELLDPTMQSNSFGFRPRRSVDHAILAAAAFRDRGFTHALRMDIRDCFGSISLTRAIATLARLGLRYADLKLIKNCLLPAIDAGSEGLPTGSPLSPILCNLVLNDLDTAFDRQSIAFVRYADDLLFVKTGQSRAAIVETD